MMHQGLDLSKFKKVSSDKKTSTLRHAKGHEIKIAHGSISTKMREELDRLPMADGGKVKRFAGGGDTEDPPMDPESPEMADDGPPAPADTPPEMQAAPGPPEAPPPELADAAPAPSPPESQGLATPAPMATPEASRSSMTAALAPRQDTSRGVSADNTIDVQAPRRERVIPPAPPTTAEQLNAQDMEWQQALARGQVKPETYQSLFAKQDTLGKIGTLFGLMLSGAGSGLSGQPNALLGMMNKQIENDLEAQKQTKSNAFNFLRQTQAHEFQKAQQEQMTAQNALTGAQTAQVQAKTGQVPIENAYTKSQIARNKAEIDSLAETTAFNRMKNAAAHNLIDMTDKMPPGPQKDAAANLISGTIVPGINASNAEDNAKAAAKVGLMKSAAGRSAPAKPGQVIDFNRFNELATAGTMGVPGGMTPADVGTATQETAMVQDNRAVAKAYKDSFERLDKMAFAGKLNPQQRAAELNSLGATVARATAGRFNAAEASAQADGMFPSAQDYGRARPEKYRKAVEFFRNQEAATPTLDRFKLKTPFPLQAPGESRAQEGETGKDKSGRVTVYRDGKWVYK